MDPIGEEQLDYGDEDFAGNPKIHHQTTAAAAAAIPAVADDEMIGDEDDFDDLYNDVNVGEHFMKHTPASLQQNPNPQNSNPNPNPKPAAVPFGGSNGSLPPPAQPPNPKIEPPANPSIHGIAVPQQNPSNFDSSRVPEYAQENINNHAGDLGFQRGPMAAPIPPKAPPAPVPRPAVGPVDVNGPTMLFVGELHWWTTDADLESILTHYGRVKEIKFFDERASGKSKGYCQVEFYDAASAATCKEGMDGYEFNGRACVVAFASPQTLRQMGESYVSRNQGQGQSQQQQQQGRRPMNDGMDRGGGGFGDGGGGRNFGRGGWGGGRGGQGMMNNRGRGFGMRGRGFAGRVGNNGPYGQGLGGPAGMMNPQNMMGAGFDPTFMGRGGPYGGFPGPVFTGMMPPFQAVGLPGVAPHVNPAFFGRGMTVNGMGVMVNNGMEGQMWGDAGMGGAREESSYGGDDGASEYGYGEVNHDRGGRSSASREKERGSDGYSERRQRDDKEQDWDGSGRERHREDRDGYRDYRSRDGEYDNEVDWDRGQSSSKSRSKSYMQEDERRPRSRDADYGKRRRE